MATATTSLLAKPRFRASVAFGPAFVFAQVFAATPWRGCFCPEGEAAGVASLALTGPLVHMEELGTVCLSSACEFRPKGNRVS
jgi:hypothetical protein